MNKECNDLEIGKFLHAYELGVLSAEEAERFEIHLLKCEYCFNELKKNESAITTLLNDDEIKASASADTRVNKTPKKGIKEILWPDLPLLLRPVVTLALVILLLYPAFLGIERLTEQKATPAQIISLVPSRSINGNVFEIGQKTDVILMFIYPKGERDRSYKLMIQDSSGKEIYHIDNFTCFDASKTGNLILSRDKFPDGSYKLIVEQGQNMDNGEMQEYNFRIIYQ